MFKSIGPKPIPGVCLLLGEIPSNNHTLIFLMSGGPGRLKNISFRFRRSQHGMRSPSERHLSLSRSTTDGDPGRRPVFRVSHCIGDFFVSLIM